MRATRRSRVTAGCVVAAAALSAGLAAQDVQASVIYSNALTANATGFTSGGAAAPTATWGAPTVSTPYYQLTIAGGAGQTSYAWSSVHPSSANLTTLANNGFSVSSDFTVSSPSQVSSTAYSFVGLAFGNNAAFQRYSGTNSFYNAQINTVAYGTGTVGALTISAQNLAGTGSGGGNIASGVTFTGGTSTYSSAGNVTSLSGSYHMVFSGSYNGSGDLTLSFTVSNLDGSSPTTISSTVLASSGYAVKPGSTYNGATMGYFGFKDTAANGGSTDRFNNFSLATVPEPTMLGVVAGLTGLGLLSRRRKVS